MFDSFFLQLPKPRKSRRKPTAVTAVIERLDDLVLLSTISVSNLNESGAGSLRQAIIAADASPGADVITFNVAGIIHLTSAALPPIHGRVDIQGNTGTGFSGSPVVEIDCNGFGGLQFAKGSSGSALRSLDVVNAEGAGVTLNGVDSILITGNYIGLGLDGATAKANSGNGLELHKSSGNTIDSNLISGNGLNGIGLDGSNNNQIATNTIGTDVTGMIDVGNARNGILVTSHSKGNVIGGEATGGNDPTNGVFVRPPQGNLISGNDENGVLVDGKSTGNQLSGNFIGTDATGNAALGNTLDGVDFRDANGNSLIGCLITNNPFVFYNVISGNGGNGLKVSSSNNTTIQANFFGLGADNQTPVGNRLNGVVVDGSSSHTLMGGPIPLGNVDAANGLNGLLVQDTVNHFITYNTFCGLAAFQTYTNLGNGGDGMLITSTGGNILIRTNVITENANDGIEISGNATGVRVAGNIVGMNTNGSAAMGNKNNGVEVNGNAHDIVIGSPQRTFNVIPHNGISGNGANGVAINGTAHDVHVNFSDIGTELLGQYAIGNGGDGVYIGSGTHSITIGSQDPNLPTVISGNVGNGIEMVGTSRNTVISTHIGTGPEGLHPIPNGSNGILLTNSFDNLIGDVSMRSSRSSRGTGNVIAFNQGNGVKVASGNHNAIRGNSITENTSLGIDIEPGANMDQAAPVLTSVITRPSGVDVTGTLTSTPKTTFKIDFFANDVSAPSGRVYLGSKTVRTNASGVAVISYRALHVPTGARFITATATSAQNNSSVFSVPIS